MLEPAREPSLRRWSACAAAAATTVAAVALQLVLGSWLAGSLLPLTLAVTAAAWAGGRGPGLTATGVATSLAAAYLFAPVGSLAVDGPGDRAELAAFLLFGLVMSVIGGAFRDTRRRLEAERARLRESDAFHAAIADLSTDFAFSARVEADGAIVTEAVTDGFADLLGYTLQELAGRGGWSGLVHPGDAERARTETRQLLRGGAVEGESRHVARDGRVLTLQYRIRPLWDERGRVVRVYGAYRDVTRQREAEGQARERERQLRLVTDHLPVLIAHHDADARFLFVNEPYAARFGLEPADVAGRPLRSVLGEERFARVAPHVEAALAGRTVQFDDELPDDGGEPEPVRVTFEPERDAPGRTVGFVAAIVSVADQRRAREALRKSEERLRLALEGARQGTWDWDARTGEVSGDERAGELFGWRRGAHASYEEHLAAIHAEEREAVAQAMRRSLERRAAFEHEHRIGASPGEPRWVQVRGHAFCDAAGRPVRLSGTVLDVTGRRQLEDALRESEARFRQLAEAMPHIAFTATPEGSVDYVNSQWYRFSGRPEDESFGLGWMQVLHPDDYAGAYRQWTQSLRTGEPFETEYRFRHGDGGFRWHLCRALPVRDGSGGVVKWVGTSTDVHEQRRLTEQLSAERAALARSERLYRAIGESIDYGVWVCDPEGRNVYASESFLRLVGLTQEQCAGFGWADALHPEDAVRTLAAWRECVRSGGRWDVEERFRGSDGLYHPVLARGVRVTDAEGRTMAWAGIHLDIARLKDAEEALRAADRRKDEFLATLAHELRNPLNPIRSAVEVLRLKGGPDPEQQWSRDAIDRQVAHLTRLIDDLLDVSRISRGKLELRREEVELAPVLRGAIDAARPLIEQNGHDLHVELAREPLWLNGDPVRLTQVFTNLLTNAAKYTEPGGRVSVTARRDGAQAVVSVRDTGLGIAPEKLPLLFEMFYQVDRSLERAQGGLGIGLSLVKQLVSLHGGAISAHSEGVSRGSEFVVRLPLAAPPRRVAGAARPGHEPARRAEPRRILVADDNRDSAASLALVLQLAGHEVDTAADGEEALAKAARAHPQVVLLDLGMPKLSGYEVCRRVRAEPWGRDVLLIAQTGWGQEEDRRRTREAGFDAHLVKPVEPSALASLIERLSPRPQGDGAGPQRLH